MEDIEVARRFAQGETEGSSNGMTIKGDAIHCNNPDLPIARQFNESGIDYLFDSIDINDEVKLPKKYRDIVLKELKGFVLHIIDCKLFTEDCGCETCKGNNAKHQLILNNEEIKRLKSFYEDDERIDWLQEQNKLLKPIALVNEL